MLRRGSWTLDDALGFVRMLNAKIGPRYYCGITGSVLFAGKSENDLDLVVYPASTEAQDKNFVRAMFGELGMKLLFDREFVTERWREAGSTDNKHVEVWEHDGKRVDIFFVS